LCEARVFGIWLFGVWRFAATVVVVVDLKFLCGLYGAFTVFRETHKIILQLPFGCN
jgi:hypothetical protein